MAVFPSQFSAGLNSDDIELWLSLWADDGVQLPDGEPAVVGKQQIRARMKNIFDQFRMNMAITNEEARAAGDLAYARGTYRLTLTPKTGGEATSINGKYVTIFNRQADGSWKFHRDSPFALTWVGVRNRMAGKGWISSDD